jgi:transcription antitermination factor NusG
MSNVDPLCVGDDVRLTHGVLSQFEGRIVEIEPVAAIAKVVLTISGKPVTLSFPIDWLERIKPR